MLTLILSVKLIYMYRVTAVMKVETEIITSIAGSPILRAVILVIIYVEIFTTDFIVFFSDVIMCMTSH
jgi:hypothetical protein